MKNIIIVESPAKSKTIETYLGDNYKVLSSVGHIRDLATSGTDGLGIDVNNDFEPDYRIIKGKQSIVNSLKKECKNNHVFLATDPDREGEAISYHLAKVLDLNLDDLDRVEFHEITKPAVLEAFKTPRKIDLDLVKSQETRRMLDRIIGFKVSKLLKSKISSQSAGRVQSVALKLICDLEREIKAFVSTPYYEIDAIFDSFKLSLESYKDSKKTIVDKAEALKIIDSLSKTYQVCEVLEKKVNRESKPPFTTSTLQQDASNKLNYTSSRTMRIAQGLYEGIAIGSEKIGLITYMRTDSTHLSNLFVNDANEYIKKNYGEIYLGHAKERHQVLAQQAHEAIRPTSISRTPDMMKRYLTNDEYRVYKLIYDRAITSLMAPARFLSKTVRFKNNDAIFKITGQTLVFDGYIKAYGKEDEDKDALIRDFKLDEIYVAKDVVLNELFTKPKSRYTEATLIKEMEELGIGRPSTYAQTMTTLKDRKYVTMDAKKLVPTEQGMITDEALAQYFSDIINVKYTADMEDILDKISKGEVNNKTELHEFYDKFIPIYNNAKDNMESIYPKQTDLICPKCGSPMVIRKSKYGEFTACSNYPKCKYILVEEKEEDNSNTLDVNCPKCGSKLVRKQALKGRNKGKFFYACSNYPECKNIYNDLPTNELCPKCGSIMLKDENNNLYCSEHCETPNNYNAVICPNCKKGHLVKKLAQKGKNKGNYFYACDNYPRCKTIFNDEPLDKKCPKCGSIMLKDKDENEYCSNPECKKMA